METSILNELHDRSQAQGSRLFESSRKVERWKDKREVEGRDGKYKFTYKSHVHLTGVSASLQKP